MRNIRTTLKRPLTHHAIVVNGERSSEKRRGGSELQRAVADQLDIWARDDPDGIEGVLRDFLTGDLIENFDRSIAPSVRRDGRHRMARRRYFQTFYRRFQLEIPFVVHALGLDLEASDEAQCLCAVFATAHYLATLNDFEMAAPDYASLAAA